VPCLNLNEQKSWSQQRLCLSSVGLRPEESLLQMVPCHGTLKADPAQKLLMHDACRTWPVGLIYDSDQRRFPLPAGFEFLPPPAAIGRFVLFPPPFPPFPRSTFLSPPYLRGGAAPFGRFVPPGLPLPLHTSRHKQLSLLHRFIAILKTLRFVSSQLHASDCAHKRTSLMHVPHLPAPPLLTPPALIPRPPPALPSPPGLRPSSRGLPFDLAAFFSASRRSFATCSRKSMLSVHVKRCKHT
jgi:hypothetical protein